MVINHTKQHRPYMNKLPALPIIEFIKTGKTFRVTWDYQTAPESLILEKHEVYLKAYINGALNALEIPEKSVQCASGWTGTVVKLDEETAQKLVRVLERLLFSIISREHKRLKREARLPPHLRSEYRLAQGD
jgi:hypothetical protein